MMSNGTQLKPDEVGDPLSAIHKESLSSLINVPNTLCAIRFVGAFALIGFAINGQAMTFLWLFVFLAITDWFDGKLAILLRQKTVFGARFDSLADATLYAAMLAGVAILKFDFVVEQRWWLVAAMASYALTMIAALIKFRRFPSYHTWSAKTCNYLVLAAVIFLFLDTGVWPFYIAAAGVIIANLEATLITITIKQWRANVPSIFHVLARTKPTNA